MKVISFLVGGAVAQVFLVVIGLTPDWAEAFHNFYFSGAGALAWGLMPREVE